MQVVRPAPRTSLVNVAVVRPPYNGAIPDSATLVPAEVVGHPPSRRTLKACRPSLRPPSSEGPHRRQRLERQDTCASDITLKFASTPKAVLIAAPKRRPAPEETRPVGLMVRQTRDKDPRPIQRPHTGSDRPLVDLAVDKAYRPTGPRDHAVLAAGP